MHARVVAKINPQSTRDPEAIFLYPMHWPLSTRDSTRAIRVATSARYDRRARGPTTPRATRPPRGCARQRTKRKFPSRIRVAVARDATSPASSAGATPRSYLAMRATTRDIVHRRHPSDARPRPAPTRPRDRAIRRTRCDAHTHTNTTYLDLGRLEGGDAGDEGGREKGRHFQGNARCANMTLSTRASRARFEIGARGWSVVRLSPGRDSPIDGSGSLDVRMRVYIRGVTRARGGW